MQQTHQLKKEQPNKNKSTNKEAKATAITATKKETKEKKSTNC